jgi:hypothetical protein
VIAILDVLMIDPMIPAVVISLVFTNEAEKTLKSANKTRRLIFFWLTALVLILQMHSSSIQQGLTQVKDPNMDFISQYQFQKLDTDICYPQNQTAEIEASLGQGKCLVRILGREEQTLNSKENLPAQANSWRFYATRASIGIVFIGMVLAIGTSF